VADTFSPKQRSEIMRRVKSKDTSPELKLRRALWHAGLKGYRRGTDLPGKPDIVFKKAKVAVFVDGCFWHKCPKCFRMPSSNQAYWERKINRNVERDKKVNAELENLGWTVVRIWEHELKDIDSVVETLRKLVKERGGAQS